MNYPFMTLVHFSTDFFSHQLIKDPSLLRILNLCHSIKNISSVLFAFYFLMNFSDMQPFKSYVVNLLVSLIVTSSLYYP